RTENEMPAIHIEVEEALAEGVKIEFLTNISSVDKDSNGRLKLQMIKYKLGEADDSGRKKPIPIEGSEYEIIADKVFAAIGQTHDDFVFSGKKVRTNQGKISYDASIPVFNAGDMAWGGTVTEAIGSGNKVAEEVHAFLRHQPYSHDEHMSEVVLPTDLNEVYYLPTPRIDNEYYHAKDFYNDFTEVVKPLTKEQIINEGHRCLSCGECFTCGNCFNFCPDAAISYDENGRLRINYDYCKGCGICVQECPSSAIDFKLIVQN
ncbi:MAG TPA: 4Fe-4S dicluster domain-containing protein, partial [Saprospiraceae bacterium]|nr:4Fe-4S dicluster domain-containing protein [Saprospiraceae bacterium]